MEELGLPPQEDKQQGASDDGAVAQRSGRKRSDPIDLFMRYVEGNAETGCWEWTGYKKDGYGHFSNGGKTYMAHRWSWRFVAGLPLPEEDLDHICTNPACVRPGHLQPASRLLNIQLRDERKGYEAPDGTVLSGPTKHRSMLESVRAVEYGLPSAWNLRPKGFEEQILPAESDGKPRQNGR